MAVEALLSCEVDARASTHSFQALGIPEKSPRNLTPSSPLVGSHRKKINQGRKTAPPVCTCDSRARGFSTPLTRRRSSYPLPSPKLMLTHQIERATVRSRVLRHSTKLSATTVPSPASHKPPSSEVGTELEFGRGASGGHNHHTTKPPSRVNQPDESGRLPGGVIS